MRTRYLLLLGLALLAAVSAGAQRREFLSEAEIEEMRETADNPPQRIRSMVKFAQVRMAAIDQLRSDPRFAKNRGARIHDLLEQFVGIVDEMDTNIDSYAEHDVDLRKPLKDVIEADTEFQLKLRTLKDAADDPKTAAEAQEYGFILEDAIEAVAGSLANARAVLEAQNAKRGEEKKEKKDEKGKGRG